MSQVGIRLLKLGMRTDEKVCIPLIVYDDDLLLFAEDARFGIEWSRSRLIRTVYAMVYTAASLRDTDPQFSDRVR